MGKPESGGQVKPSRVLQSGAMATKKATKASKKSPVDGSSPEPKPSTEKHYTLKALQDATLAHCALWWSWQWGTNFSETAAGLDYRGRLEAWPKVKEAEDEARKAVSQLNVYIREALAVAGSAKESPYTGFHCQALLAAAPHLELAQKAMSAYSWATQVPVCEPTRQRWLTEIVAPRYTLDRAGEMLKLEDFCVDELAMYAIIAGFWPNAVSIDAPRLPVADGVSVRRVLSEERKNISAAHKELIAEQQRVLEEWKTTEIQAEVAAVVARLKSDGKA